MEPGCRFTLLGCSHPFVEEAELLGFAVGSADYLSPQTHSLCLWWLQKAAKLQGLCLVPKNFPTKTSLSITSPSHQNIKYSKQLMHGVLNVVK